MITVKIPTLKSNKNVRGDLKIIISVGTHGFKRTEIMRRGTWAPNDIIYVDNESTQVEFSIDSKDSVIVRTIPKIDPLENVFTKVRYSK